ncbi:MAG: hypothetical protein CGU28_09360 [Candidatus Dactylopiibacterium carminicum]|nr:MAG: hypothetical protein CGU28_09360 [Candidatus Dactylopiibacterium carminicum]
MEAAHTILRIAVPASGLADAPLRCCRITAGQSPQEGDSTLTRLQQGQRVELVLPASQVAAHRLVIPAASARHTQALVRQALEDRLLGDLADSHVVSGERQGERLTVWIVSRRWLQTQLDTCTAAGLAVVRVLPDLALLPPASHCETDAGWIFRSTEDAFGIVNDAELLPALAGETQALQTPLLAAPAQAPLDLLQGLPTSARSVRAALWPQLRLAAALLAGVALVIVFGQLLQWRELAAQQATLHQRIRQSFAAAHPGVPIVNPILQWRQLQGNPARNADALDLLGVLAGRLGAPVAAQRIEADENGLQLTLPLSAARSLEERLREQGLAATTRTTESGLELVAISRAALENRP